SWSGWFVFISRFPRYNHCKEMGKNKNIKKIKYNSFKDVNETANAEGNKESTDIESWIGPMNDPSNEKQSSSGNQTSLVLPYSEASSEILLPSVKMVSGSSEKIIIENSKRVVQVEANVEPTHAEISFGNPENHVSTYTAKHNQYHASEIKDISQHTIQCPEKGKEVVPKLKPCFTEYGRRRNQPTPTRHYENKCFSMTNGKLENLNGRLYDNSPVTLIKYNKNEGSVGKRVREKSSLSGANNTGARPKTDIQGLKNQSKSRFNLASQEIDQIYDVRTYKAEWSFFLRNYLDWKKNRQLIITELKNLKKKVHDDQLGFNQTNAALTDINVYSRLAQYVPGVRLIAGIATFLTDVASTKTSADQAANVHDYITKFKKIMERDADASKFLLSTLSQCVKKHKNIEKIIRKFHSEIFIENRDKSFSSRSSILWIDLKKSFRIDDVSDRIIQLDNFFSKNFAFDDWKNFWESIVEYTNDNPAVLDACVSARSAVHSAHHVVKKDVNILRHVFNFYEIQHAMSKSNKLERLINDETMPQAKLESHIIDAIDLLRSQLIEIIIFITEIRNLM
ncbi:uncharacterized protein TNIN_432951, partial [Trichonephila inaurata madagascariensis]